MSVLVTLLILVAVAVVLSAMIVGIYNKLVTYRNRYKNAFAQIEVQLKRRHDLIPNLVETVKGYMAHERGTLEAVITARNQAVGGLQQAAQDPGTPRPSGSSALPRVRSAARSAGCSRCRRTIPI
jgi:LemA protein